jgi:NAD(P)-dependent dehydrogenase (short-subunit alcohol dehydrogenase family)
MSGPRKTAIVTGASQGIGAGVANEFVQRGYNVVANSRSIARSAEVTASDYVALVDGDIGKPETAARIVETALGRFKSIDVLVNNAGIIFNKPFTQYTEGDLELLMSTNVGGFLYLTQGCVRQMLTQKSRGSIVTITAALVRNPIRGTTASVPMITKGGLDAVTLQLAMEYAKEGIRFNAVAPGVVDTDLHDGTPQELLKSRSPMGRIPTVGEIADAVMYLTEAESVTGQTIYVDGGGHFGCWGLGGEDE